MLFMVPVVQQKVEMVSPHTQLDAVIDNDSLNGNIKLPVTFQQTIPSDNPQILRIHTNRQEIKAMAITHLSRHRCRLTKYLFIFTYAE